MVLYDVLPMEGIWMRKTVWYLVQDLTTGTQKECKGQKKLLECLRDMKCSVDNNSLPQILRVPSNKEELDGEDVGELNIISEDDHDICVMELFCI